MKVCPGARLALVCFCGNVRHSETKANSGEQTHKELRMAMHSIDMSCADSLYTVIGSVVH
jgi:hypothetical protein